MFNTERQGNNKLDSDAKGLESLIACSSMNSSRACAYDEEAKDRPAISPLSAMISFENSQSPSTGISLPRTNQAIYVFCISSA